MRTMRWIGIFVVWMAAALWCGLAAVQDTRQVEEPKIPQACATLEAQLAGGTWRTRPR
jgi:hypothetical protein